MLRWTDINDIAIELSEMYPDEDPLKINFVTLRELVMSIDNFSDDVRPTGPHNSFLFLILNYGFIGLLLFLNIFIKPLKIFFSKFSKNLIDSKYLFLGSFVALSFTGDFIQNHSISVLFFLLLFESLREEDNAK